MRLVSGNGLSPEMSYADTSATAGNATAHTQRGRSKGTAAAPSVCVLTNALVRATSTVLVTHRLGPAAAYQSTSIAAIADGSFRVEFSSTSNQSVTFDWMVIN